METIKKERKYLLILIGLITFISWMYFLPSIIKGVPITFGTDIKPQWFEFYAEFRNLMVTFIKTRQLPFYSWNSFLGSNFYAAKSYYLMGDIYSYIGLLMRGDFFAVARNLSYLKFLVAGLTFYGYLTEVGRKPLAKLMCSIAYAFSGWAIFFSGQLVFLSFYSFIPLYLWGLERCLNKKNPWMFSVACALGFSTNYYFFYTLTLISPVYYIYRYMVLELPWKDFFSSVIKQILYYVIGILITAVIWVPGIIYITSSSRFDRIDNDFNLIVYLNYFFSVFVPNYLYIYRNNVFNTDQHYTREICMWAGSWVVLLVPQFGKLFSKREHKLTLGFYLIFFVIAMIPYLDSVMHGFSDPSFRWVFILVIFNLYVASYVIDHIDELDCKLLKICTMAIPVIMLGCFGLALIYIRGSIGDYLKQFIIVLIYISIILVCSYLIMHKKLKSLLVVLVLELTGSGVYCYAQDIYSKPDDTYQRINQVTHVIQSYPNEIMNTINGLKEENSTEFIRLYIPLYSVYWDFSHNMSLHYGIKGLMTYDSTFASSFNEMKELVPDVNMFDSDWIFNIEDDNLMSFLNTKYAIVTGSDKLSDQWVLVEDDYHYGFLIYENTAYRSLGTTYSKVISKEDYKKVKDTSLFLDTVIVDDVNKVNSYLSDEVVSLEHISYQSNYLYGDYTASEDGFMVLGIPYDEGWSISIDGDKVDYLQCNGGCIGLAIPSGYHELTMYFMPKGFKLGLVLSGVGLLSFVGLLLTRRR